MPVVEDAAHAVESRYRGRKLGGLSDATCFSLYATKNLAAGEGGLVATPQQYVMFLWLISSFEYVLLSAASRVLTSGLSVGSRLPAFCTSMGRVLQPCLTPTSTRTCAR